MRRGFVQIEGDHFAVDGRPILLRGYILGSWMNLEHFMMGLPGTPTMIREAFAEVYGPENAARFFDTLLKAMVQEEDILLLKQMGTNTVRIPFGYRYFIDDQHPDVFQEYGFAMLERVLGYCRKHGMYAILDLHTAPGAQNNDWHADSLTGQSMFWRYRCFQDQVCALWREIARRYADDPCIAGYDVLNEPGYGLAPETINGFYQRVTQAVREVDRDHILFLEGADFGRDFTPLREPDDPQSTFAVHYYPFVLEEDVLDPAMPEERRDEIFKRIFDRQLEVRDRFHRPIWCGETGYNLLDGQEAFFAKLLMKNIALCEQNGLSWSIWSYKDARRMGIVIPKEDSPWMRLRRRLEERWVHEWEQATSMKITREIGERYYQPLDDALAYDLDFRVRSILHRIAVEQILKPTLRAIPWDEIKDYPHSFDIERCDRREEVIRAVTALLTREDGRTDGSSH